MPGTQDSINKCELPSERLRLRAGPSEGASPDLTVTEKTSNVIRSLEAAPALGLRLPDSALLSQTLHLPLQLKEGWPPAGRSYGAAR